MRTSHWSLRTALLIVVLASAVTALRADDKQPVSFPEGYRAWQHVKSVVIGPEHSLFPTRGGFSHTYANDLAVVGYRTGKYPNGSVVVVEGVFVIDGEGSAKGIVLEGGRRFLDVMVKDDVLYKDTGGWGFEHFEGEEKTSQRTAGDQKKCHECHAKAPDHGQIFSRIRP